MSNSTTLVSATLPWTRELIPELPDGASESETLTFIACALRRQLQITMPEGAILDCNGQVIVPDRA